MPIYNDGFHCHGDLHSPIGIGPRGPKGEKGDTFKFADMTEDQINSLRTDISSVYYQKKEMTITTSVADTSTITIPFNDYDETDMLLINIDGLMLSDGTDYSIDGWNIVLNEPIANPGTHVNLIMLSAIALNVQDLGSLIPFEGVTTEKIAYKAVTKDKLGDGSVTDVKLAANSVTSLKIANQAVTGTKLSDGSVSASKLAKDSVTNESLADNAVKASNIDSGAVVTTKLASGAVITSKLGNNSVTSEKLAVDAVKGSNIYNEAVVTTKLANGAVTSAKLADNAVTIDKINNDAKQKLTSNILYAADATTAQTLTTLGFTTIVLTPQNASSMTDAYGMPIQMSTRSMLCWTNTEGGYLEKAPLCFTIDFDDNSNIRLWAKGLYSKATGLLGVDTSWTITKNV